MSPRAHIFILSSLAILLGGMTGCDADNQPEDGRATCIEDRFQGQSVSPLSVGRIEDLRVCPGVADVFNVGVEVMGAVELLVTAEMPVEAEVQGGRFEEGSKVGTELIFRGVVTEGSVAISVRGDDVGYEIELRVLSEPLACYRAPRDEADELPTDISRESLCGDGTYWTLFSGQPGDLLRWTVTAGDSDIEMEVFEQESGVFLRSAALSVVAETAGESSRAFPPSGLLHLRLRGDRGAEFSLRAESVERGQEPGRVDGHLELWRRAGDEDGLSEPIVVDGGRVRMDVLGADGAVLRSFLTDANGDFDTDFIAIESESLSLRVAAATWSGRGMVRVGPGMGDDRPWSITTSMSTESENIIRVDVEEPTNAALFVALIGASGLRDMDHLLPPWDIGIPTVRYLWRPNGATECGTCFRPGPRPVIELSGRREDPDEWDRSVILHELSHYMVAVYGRDDSTGGPHSGMRTQPVVAWSEGVATFLASVLLQSSVQFDYRAMGVRRVDLESYSEPESFGTEDETQEGEVSEYLVATLLWDLFDAPDNDDDATSIPLATLLEPIFGGALSDAEDRGFPGLDLVDYLDALGCVDGVESVLEQRRFPYDGLNCAE